MNARTMILALLLLSTGIRFSEARLPTPPPCQQWILIELNGTAIDPAAMVPIYLTFDSSENRYEGFGGCNRLMGRYTEGSNGAFVFSSVTSTKVGCEDAARLQRETMLAEAMVLVDRCEKNEKQLEFFAANRRILVFMAIGGSSFAENQN